MGSLRMIYETRDPVVEELELLGWETVPSTVT